VIPKAPCGVEQSRTY